MPSGIQQHLSRLKKKKVNAEDYLITETKKILAKDLFADKKILSNLKQYNRSFEVIDEEDVDCDQVFSLQEIKRIAIIWRLKFLDSTIYKGEIPYEAVLTIKQLNKTFRKDLKAFKVLAPGEDFRNPVATHEALLFVKTNYENYYLLNKWGRPLQRFRHIRYWPLRSFENLLFTVVALTLIVTMVLPTHLITLDSKAQYWSGYRAAAFFHLLIFISGFTAFFAFAFSQNFSDTIWDRKRNFD